MARRLRERTCVICLLSWFPRMRVILSGYLTCKEHGSQDIGLPGLRRSLAGVGLLHGLQRAVAVRCQLTEARGRAYLPRRTPV